MSPRFRRESLCLFDSEMAVSAGILVTLRVMGVVMRTFALVPVLSLTVLGGLSTSGCSNAECERIIQEAVSVASQIRSETCKQQQARDQFAADEITFQEMQEEIFDSRERIMAAEEKIKLQASECPEGDDEMLNAAVVAGSRTC